MQHKNITDQCMNIECIDIRIGCVHNLDTNQIYDGNKHNRRNKANINASKSVDEIFFE